ncbi:MAG: hypothetical protein KDM91_03745 [Verrucomicrobiae bacterium]|nr:hypothetical protein [Verrucomicrobiae bacterium]
MKSFQELPDYRELRKLWKQEPIERPVPDLELTPDSWVERGAEVIGWWLARLEYWLSESGWLRAWLRLNLLVSIVLTIAGVLLLPPVAQVLEQVAKSSHWLGAIFGDLVGMLTALPPVVISLGVLYLGFVVVRRFRRKRLMNRGGYGHDDGWQ